MIFPFTRNEFIHFYNNERKCYKLLTMASLDRYSLPVSTGYRQPHDMGLESHAQSLSKVVHKSRKVAEEKVHQLVATCKHTNWKIRKLPFRTFCSVPCCILHTSCCSKLSVKFITTKAFQSGFQMHLILAFLRISSPSAASLNASLLYATQDTLGRRVRCLSPNRPASFTTSCIKIHFDLSLPLLLAALEQDKSLIKGFSFAFRKLSECIRV